MDAYRVVLYVHLLALFVGIGAGAVLVVCLVRLRRAGTLAEALPWATVAAGTDRIFPVSVLALFGSGAYMTSDVWTWGTGWIDAGLGGLVLLALQGPLVGGRRAKRLEHALRENGPGRLEERAHRAARQPALWLSELSNLGVVLGVVWDMTEKPALGAAIAAIVVGYAVGAVLALRISRAPAGAGATAAETAP